MKKTALKNIMDTAWYFVSFDNIKINAALRCSWANYRLREQMKNDIVEFKFIKKDGTIREAHGTLISNMLPPIKGTKTTNKSVQVYFDTDKQEYRCFKKANLLFGGK